MTITSKRTIYISVGIFVVLGVGIKIFLIFPTIADIKAASSKILEDRGKAILLRDQNHEIENFKKKYSEYKPNLEKVDDVFFDPQNPISFIKFLERTALDLGIDATINVAPGIQQRDNLNVTVFQVATQGDFQNIVRFAEQLETGPYLIKIYHLTMQKVKLLPGILEKESEAVPKKVTGNFLIEVVSK